MRVNILADFPLPTVNDFSDTTRALLAIADSGGTNGQEQAFAKVLEFLQRHLPPQLQAQRVKTLAPGLSSIDQDDIVILNSAWPVSKKRNVKLGGIGIRCIAKVLDKANASEVADINRYAAVVATAYRRDPVPGSEQILPPQVNVLFLRGVQRLRDLVEKRAEGPTTTVAIHILRHELDCLGVKAGPGAMLINDIDEKKNNVCLAAQRVNGGLQDFYYQVLDFALFEEAGTGYEYEGLCSSRPDWGGWTNIRKTFSALHRPIVPGGYV